jgi:hypothetical protein
MRMTTIHSLAGRLRAEGGFTMIVAMGVMLVTSLLLVAAFTAANGDQQVSHESTLQQQAYYAALAGVQEYQYRLENNTDFWDTCEPVTGEETNEHFEVKVLVAHSAPSGTTACESSNPFKSAIESKGALANTFRVESVGCAGIVKGITSCSGHHATEVQERKIVATFKVTGFLDYAYFTQYEDQDYSLYGGSSGCEAYHETRPASCHNIEFISEDSVHGPIHTDDAALVCGEVEFGRAKQLPTDAIEINGGVYAEGTGCSARPIYNGTMTEAPPNEELVAPATDKSLLLYAEPANIIGGNTHLVLNGTKNEITITAENGETLAKPRSLKWPTNGLLYVQSDGTCSFTYAQGPAGLVEELAQTKSCGTVYVSGTYSKSLTIAAARDIVIAGNISPTGLTLGAEPTGTATLGLIATQDVRIAHPVGETYAKGSGCKSYSEGRHTFVDSTVNSTTCEYTNEYYAAGGFYSCDAPNAAAANPGGTLTNPYVYAAILSTSHSFLVDNYDCGNVAETGTLHIYGAIAQKFRGVVGSGEDEHGYLKDYKYDSRLATDEPPYFLAPLKAGWKVIRETAAENG